MPTYEYRCPEGHEFEHFFRSISGAKAEMPCPTCGRISSRMMSLGAGLVFKGSGFYITDYGKDGKKDQRARPSGVESSKGEGGKSGSDGGTTTGASSGESGSGTPKSGDGAKSSGSSGGEKSGGSSGGSSGSSGGSGGSSGGSGGGSSSGGSSSGGSSSGGSSGSGSKE